MCGFSCQVREDGLGEISSSFRSTDHPVGGALPVRMFPMAADFDAVSEQVGKVNGPLSELVVFLKETPPLRRIFSMRTDGNEPTLVSFAASGGFQAAQTTSD